MRFRLRTLGRFAGAQRRRRSRRADDLRRDAAILEGGPGLNEEIKSAGAWVFGGALTEPDTATVVRMSKDKVMITDGPFTESKEQIAGFCVIEVDDLDDALAWASKTTAVVGKPMEVRPFRASES